MKQAKEVLSHLYSYCKSEQFQGYDPYDGLKSRLFIATPLNKYKITRQAWTQFNKRSPLNLRKIFLIEKGSNPKGLALFILGLINLFKSSQNEEYLDTATKLLKILNEIKISGYSGNCWGYNFPWQSRSFYAPKNTPNAICSIFACDAFLEAFAITKKQEYLDTAINSINFFIKDLKKKEEDCFSYTPIDNSKIHNINLFTAYIITKLNIYLNNSEISPLAQKALEFSIEKQNNDGSWYYGTQRNQRWVDNFHTGFNLMALKRYFKIVPDSNAQRSMLKGYEFFDKNFLVDSRIPKYFVNKIYPIDIHSCAVSIITYNLFSDIDPGANEKFQHITNWTINNLFSKKGYFYFQKNRLYLNKIQYMRWAQSWMFYALSLIGES